MKSESKYNNPPTSRRGQNMILFSPSTPRAKNIGNNRRKRRVHRKSEEHLRCTTALSRRAPRGDKRHANNRAGNDNTRLWYGRTGTIQLSPYQLKLRGNGKVGTDECDHEQHAGATENTPLGTKKSEAKKKVLMLELRKKFHSREKNLLSKESGTPRRSVLQKKGWMAVKRDVNDG